MKLPLLMDAANLEFANESFDFVFSFDAFEHFKEPESVLKEAVRVLRKGGYIYLFFGPLYMSPMGLHAYRSITVPYCQFFFPKELLEEYADTNGLDAINFSQINYWALEDYRNLWKKYSNILEIIRYHEIPNVYVDAVEENEANEFELSVYPNPVTSTATIQFELDRPMNVSLVVSDALGRNVYTLNDNYSAGTQTILVDGSTLTSGVYICQLVANGRIQSEMLIIE